VLDIKHNEWGGGEERRIYAKRSLKEGGREKIGGEERPSRGRISGESDHVSSCGAQAGDL